MGILSLPDVVLDIRVTRKNKAWSPSYVTYSVEGRQTETDRVQLTKVHRKE